MEEVQENVAVPDPDTEVGLIVPQDSPVGTVSVRLIVAANWSREFRVTVVERELPTLAGDGDVAVIVKSWTVNVTVIEWERFELVPVILTETVEADVNVHDRVELPEPARLVGFSVQAVLFVVRLTKLAKELVGVIVIVDFPVALTLTLMLVGLAVMLKSWTVYVTVAL